VPETAAELRDMLAQSIVEVRAGKMDPKVANSISYLAASFLRAVEAAGFNPGQQANVQGATAYQVYEAAWLREFVTFNVENGDVGTKSTVPVP
jgi:hypothetical protein